MDGEQWHKHRKAAERLLVALAENSSETVATLRDDELARVCDPIAIVGAAAVTERETRKKKREGGAP